MSPPVIRYNCSMSRWQPNARGRLEQAALELYRERGFDQTTVTEIAERAGLTERTFFRYFADKREVLFWGQDRLCELYVNTIEAAPEAAAPLDAVAAALEAAAPVFRERHALARQRQTVIDATAGLQERELLKRAALASPWPTRCADAACPTLPRASPQKSASSRSRPRSPAGSAHRTSTTWRNSSESPSTSSGSSLRAHDYSASERRAPRHQPGDEWPWQWLLPISGQNRAFSAEAALSPRFARRGQTG